MTCSIASASGAAPRAAQARVVSPANQSSAGGCHSPTAQSAPRRSDSRIPGAGRQASEPKGKPSAASASRAAPTAVSPGDQATGAPPRTSASVRRSARVAIATSRSARRPAAMSSSPPRRNATSSGRAPGHRWRTPPSATVARSPGVAGWLTTSSAPSGRGGWPSPGCGQVSNTRRWRWPGARGPPPRGQTAYRQSSAQRTRSRPGDRCTPQTAP